MRPSSLIVLEILTILFAGCAQPQLRQAALIGFYNVENLFDTINQPDVQDDEFTPDGIKHYNGKIYRDRLNKLSRVIAEMGTDVAPQGIALLGLAEVENKSVLDDLVKSSGLKDRNYQIVHVDGPDERGIDVAFLYNPDYFALNQVQSLHVPVEHIDASHGFTRDILYVSGELLREPIHVLVNHWPSRRGGAKESKPLRALAAMICRQMVDSLIKLNAQSKIIVMGDFNDDPVDESLTNILKVSGAENRNPSDELYNPWVKIHHSGMGTTKYNDVWYLFDQIIVSASLTKNHPQAGFIIKDAVIFKRDYLIQRTGKNRGYPLRSYSNNFYIGGYSDHLPVYITLVKP